MTPPRFIVTGATYLITRRCIGGRYLLRPDEDMMPAIVYCLAVAAKRYNIKVHALCVMSNHYHLIATDQDGKLPLFTQYLHRIITHCVQKIRRWDEVVWEPGKRTSMVELLDDNAAIDKTLYTLCNPIKAGICRKEHQWPGNVIGGSHTLQRPSCFKTDKMCSQAELRFTPPPAFDADEWKEALIAQRTHARAEARELAKAQRSDTIHIGVKAALRTKPTFRSRAKRIKGEPSPRFACRCSKTLRAAVERMRTFFSAYRTAVKEYAQGIVTEFPEGTWKMKRLLGHP